MAVKMYNVCMGYVMKVEQTLLFIISHQVHCCGQVLVKVGEHRLDVVLIEDSLPCKASLLCP